LRTLSLLDYSSSQLSPTPPQNYNSNPPTPLPSPLLIADPNYRLIQQKYLTAPATPAQTASPKPMSRSSSTQSSLSDVSVPSGAMLKNWRSMERAMTDNGRVLISLSIEKLEIRDKSVLRIILNKLKISSRISSIGSPFTNISFDGFSVNDNLMASGGLRIWIDGNISSDKSRVFCLMPPISIRFDPKFAAIVEKYLLEIIEVLKPLNRSPSTTTNQVIEFLQVSSMQLELHAKEMLGVLALDKAMINLTRSSVYKSDGVVDAISSLMSQYREEVVGQWLSLLMRLDVSIGRPVSAARKIIGGITDLFSSNS
jgi:hypothetical protein